MTIETLQKQIYIIYMDIILYTYLQHVVSTSFSECFCHRDYQVNHLKYAKNLR